MGKVKLAGFALAYRKNNELYYRYE